MLSKTKRSFKKICPRFLLNGAVVIVKKARMIRARAIMFLNPKKGIWYCPCCGYRFQAFVSGDYIQRQNRFNVSRYQKTKQDVLCPVCKSLPRHRILASWCNKYTELFKRSKVLYFAPEYSMALWMKRNGITCTTADLYARADLKLDIQSTGLPEASYDIVIANHVLEHVDDFRAALKEMYRILIPGGSFICSFPMDPKVELIDEAEKPLSEEERLRRFGQNDHKRVFGMKADQFLSDAGFDVEKIEGDDYPEEILPIVGPADYDMNTLFCCRKEMGMN